MAGHILFWLQREYCVVVVMMTVVRSFEVMFAVQAAVTIRSVLYWLRQSDVCMSSGQVL